MYIGYTCKARGIPRCLNKKEKVSSCFGPNLVVMLIHSSDFAHMLCTVMRCLAIQTLVHVHSIANHASVKNIH